LENLPFLIAAVLMADVAGVERSTTNWYASAYVLSRVAYLGLYMFGTSGKRALSRSTVWILGVGLVVRLMLLAAGKRSTSQ
jgi:uncharacterized MAPEG superfamily protein